MNSLIGHPEPSPPIRTVPKGVRISSCNFFFYPFIFFHSPPQPLSCPINVATCHGMSKSMPHPHPHLHLLPSREKEL